MQLEGTKEEEKRNEIQNIYDKFHQEFYSQDFVAIRDALKSISLRNKNNKKYLHDLGKFVVFYSLPTLSPKVVVIGDNPSWFHQGNPDLAKINLDDVAEKIPTVNSYKDHDHKFGNQLIDIFTAIEREHWIDEVVGLNRFWVQTGGGGTKELKDECKNNGKKDKYDTIKNLCENYTKDLVKLLNPKLVILLGKKAQKIYYPGVKSFYNPNQKSFIFAIHPARGQWKNTAYEIYKFLNEYEINY